MAKIPVRRSRIKLHYPKHALSPEDLLHFVETTTFTNAWEDLGLDDENDLTALQLLIMCSPTAQPVVPGTGGLRKLRFVPPKATIGKRGGCRVCYVYFEEYWVVLLVHVYDKHAKDNLSEAEKRIVRDLIVRAKKVLERLGTVSHKKKK